MSHRPAMDPDSPNYSNDDPTWGESARRRRAMPRFYDDLTLLRVERRLAEIAIAAGKALNKRMEDRRRDK